MKKIKIILSGASGRLCSVIAKMVKERDDCEILCGVDVSEKSDSEFPIYNSFDKITESADVIIDCSYHTSVVALLEYAIKTRTPSVICTTGHTDDELSLIRKASENIPILKSRNMSLGINLLTELTKKATAILGDDFDVEIVEAHHRNKLDAPSGTALMLADAAREAMEERNVEAEYIYDRTNVRRKRSSSEIGISSVRGGTIVGEHAVIFAGEDEVIKLSHSAGSRNLFASGAVRAALFLYNQDSGLYTMSDVIEEMLK